MAERERFRADRRAFAFGVAYGLACGAVAGAVCYGLAYLIIPAVRDLIGDLPVHPWSVAAVGGSLVGLVLGWSRVCAAGRVVAVGPASDLPPGSRALAILLAELGATDADQPVARGLAGSGPVQRWSPDLLRGGDLRPAEEVTTDAAS